MHHSRTFIHAVFSDWMHRLRPILSILICSIIAVLPCIYLNGTPWWLSLCIGLMLITLLLMCLRNWWLGGDTATIFWRWEYLLFLAPIAWCLLQLLPLGGLLPILAPHNAQLKAAFNQLSIGHAPSCVSMAIDGTRRQIIAWFMGFLAFFLVVNRVRSEKTLRWVVISVFVAALGNAIYSLFQLQSLSSSVANINFQGMFLNRNHFAFLMNMGIFAGLGLYFSTKAPEASPFPNSTWRPKQIKWGIPIAFCLLLMTAAMLISQSRGGFLGTCVGGIIFAALAIFKVQPNTTNSTPPSFKKHIIALTLLLVILGCYGLYHGANRVFKRFETIELKDVPGDRIAVWKMSLRMAKKYWLTGVGAGAYATITPQHYDTCQLLIANAHNDYLEMAAEYGLVFTTLWLAGALWLLWRLAKQILTRHDRLPAWCGLAALSILVGNAVHEWTDFNLQAWSNALCYATLLGVAVVCSKDFPSDHSCHDTYQRRIHRWRWVYLYLPVLYLLLCMTVYFFRQIPAQYYLLKLHKELARDVDPMLLGTGDDNRRIQLTKKAAQDSPFRSAYLHLCARVFWEASLRHGKVTPKYLAQACDTVSHLLTLAPCTPIDVVACARFYDDANRTNVRHDPPAMVIALYEWALACQPNETEVALQVAQSIYPYYMYMMRTEPRQAKLLEPRIMAIMRQAMITNPQSEELCHLLLRMKVPQTQILQCLPDTTSSQLLLAKCLKSTGRFQEALDIIHKYTRAPMPTNADKNEISLKIKAILLEMELKEILGQRQDIQQEWALLYNQLRAQAMEKISNLPDNEASMMVIRNACWRNPAIPEVNLTAATLSIQRGEADQTPFFLLNLIQPDLNHAGELNHHFIQQAIQLLPRNISLNPPTAFRVKALDAIFVIMLNEAQAKQGLPVNITALRKASDELQILGQHSINAEHESLWGQAHLAHIFAARGYLLLKDIPRCIENCRDALVQSPNNWYALQVLHKADASKLSAAEQHLYQALSARKDPIVRFSNGLSLLGTESLPYVVTTKTPEQTVILYFLLEREIQFAVKGSMDYVEGNGAHRFKTKTLFPAPGQTMFSWRIGEIHRVATRNSQWAKKNQLFPKGPCFLRLNVQPEGDFKLDLYPSPIFRVGEIK